LKDERLQTRISAKLKEQAARVAKRRHMSLTALVIHLLTKEVVDDALERRAQQEAEQI
jgi:antitoxin component of RelBE/YafQ-DinJ toxin-antitoxin module